jgi:hypothetical protein
MDLDNKERLYSSFMPSFMLTLTVLAKSLRHKRLDFSYINFAERVQKKDENAINYR